MTAYVNVYTISWNVLKIVLAMHAPYCSKVFYNEIGECSTIFHSRSP